MCICSMTTQCCINNWRHFSNEISYDVAQKEKNKCEMPAVKLAELKEKDDDDDENERKNTWCKTNSIEFK